MRKGREERVGKSKSKSKSKRARGGNGRGGRRGEEPEEE
jgi:hypothetical protein